MCAIFRRVGACPPGADRCVISRFGTPLSGRFCGRGLIWRRAGSVRPRLMRCDDDTARPAVSCCRVAERCGAVRDPPPGSDAGKWPPPAAGDASIPPSVEPSLLPARSDHHKPAHTVPGGRKTPQPHPARLTRSWRYRFGLLSSVLRAAYDRRNVVVVIAKLCPIVLVGFDYT